MRGIAIGIVIPGIPDPNYIALAQLVGDLSSKAPLIHECSVGATQVCNAVRTRLQVNARMMAGNLGIVYHELVI